MTSEIELKTEAAKKYDLTGQCSLEAFGIGEIILSNIEDAYCAETLGEVKLTQSELELLVLYTKSLGIGILGDEKIISVIKKHIKGVSVIRVFGIKVKIIGE